MRFLPVDQFRPSGYAETSGKDELPPEQESGNSLQGQAGPMNVQSISAGGAWGSDSRTHQEQTIDRKTAFLGTRRESCCSREMRLASQRLGPEARRTAELAEMKKQLEKHALDVEVLSASPCLLRTCLKHCCRLQFSVQSVLLNAQSGGRLEQTCSHGKLHYCGCEARCQGQQEGGEIQAGRRLSIWHRPTLSHGRNRDCKGLHPFGCTNDICRRGRRNP